MSDVLGDLRWVMDANRQGWGRLVTLGQVGVDSAVRAYVAGRIDVEELERRIEVALRHRYADVPTVDTMWLDLR